MGVHVLEVLVSDEELRALEARARAAGLPNPIAYLKDFVRRDPAESPNGNPAPVSADMTFAEILAPLHAEVAASGITDEELDTLFDQALKEVRAERREREREDEKKDAESGGRA